MCVRVCERENESERVGICATNCMHIKPMADRMAQNLEILSKNFQFSARILKGFMTSVCVLQCVAVFCSVLQCVTLCCRECAYSFSQGIYD